MKRGFVTIATGDKRYYNMARMLLRSYRQNCASPIRFALIADQENEYTKEFDEVVILENPTNSWVDKLQLLRCCPYDENIFIDADCLVYKDINFLWSLFEMADDFSCFGRELPMDSEEGWFKRDVQKLYPIHFITHLHGMLYFIRKGKEINEMDKWCRKIISDYRNISFKAFNDTLADEPVFALAMAIMNFKPIERKPEYYCFVPFATKLSTNYFRRCVKYANPKDGIVTTCAIVHWGNKNTLKWRYRADVYTIKVTYNKDSISCFEMMLEQLRLVRLVYWLIDIYNKLTRFFNYFFRRVCEKIKRILHH